MYLIVFAGLVAYDIFPQLYFPSILDNDLFYMLLAIFIVPAFFILPGIFYDRKFEKGNFLFSFDNFKYGLFLGLTMGLGPFLLFFIKYDKPLKEYYKNID